MAGTGMQSFEAALRSDESLQQQFQDAIGRIADANEASSDGEVLAKAAAELGFDVSLEEIEQAWADAQELDDAELAAVAGGEKDLIHTLTEGLDEEGHDSWCLVFWHCATAYTHEETTSTDVMCWSDYHCFIKNN